MRAAMSACSPRRAARLGANAVVGIDVDYETIGQGNSMMMVAVSGTAVVL